ncbi:MULTISPECIES: IS4 family transposase [Heyndrickxia]|uniref:Transposase n=2 Tax=Heyndrickxia TaxID=2837504 RepID=A0AAU7WGJ4_9BACI|nr:transposase [Heyndrickxia coagulans]APB37678.1 transposase [Heyndrickxia coagulans]MED4345652.1 transposase [Heyndrickxia coagulans]NMH83550.1 transposase [Heyndrickxia coagulans]QPG53473.1 transposase [Heyndrickxia coagulans]WNE61505.1 transposase [Heyndrickxia coagulans]
MKIITQNDHQSLEILSSIEAFFLRFRLSQIAKVSNAVKTKGVPFQTLFCYLISTLFSNRSAYRDYLKHQDQLGFSDKTFRNLLNNGKINWQKFLVLLCRRIIVFIEPLTEPTRRNVFIVDDSMYERASAKHVELAAFQFDHAKHKYTRGFRFLQLGWSDGNTFLPVNFSLLSGKNQVCSPKSIDGRTLSGKRKIQAQRKATNVVLELLSSALSQGVNASYVLFDSWFSSPKMFHQLREMGLHGVAMVKRSKKVYYQFNGGLIDVKTIFNTQKKRRGRSRYLLSVLVEAVDGETSVPVKLVYIRNRNKRNDYLVLATTDTRLSEDEVIQLYGKRWSIEVYFKMCKQYLRLAKYQGLSYDGIFAHTALVAIGYSILAVQHREQVDDRTLGELFYLMVDELTDITFAEAIQQLIDLFKEAFKDEYILCEEVLNTIIEQFLKKLPVSYQKHLIKAA